MAHGDKARFTFRVRLAVNPDGLSLEIAQKPTAAPTEFHGVVYIVGKVFHSQNHDFPFWIDAIGADKWAADGRAVL